MPNWCENILRIEGPGALEFLRSCIEDYDERHNLRPELNTFTDERHNLRPELNTFTFGILVPTDGTYDDNRNKWGTKWDPSPVIVNEARNNLVVLYFNTAWSPPEEWVDAVSKIVPFLKFTLSYFEPGVFFVGRHVVQEGRVLEDAIFTEDNKDFWALVEEEFGYTREEWISEDEEEVVCK